MLEHVPLFKHGLLEHGRESVWHATPFRYWLHWHTYLFVRESSTQMPWLEQFDKHADKSPVYVVRTELSWLPVLFIENKDDAFILIDDDEILFIVEVVIDENECEVYDEVSVCVEVDVNDAKILVNDDELVVDDEVLELVAESKNKEIILI